MKRSKLLTSLLSLTLSLVFSVFVLAQETTKAKDVSKSTSQVQKTTIDPSKIQHGRRFVDKDANGYKDNAPDHDNDGIPNGVDPDYAGAKNRSGKSGKGFVDNNGDGVNDNLNINRGRIGRKGRGGYGSGSERGACDGTGPKGSINRTSGK
jgi:hypothetical protein